jgi:hypothetical protein
VRQIDFVSLKRDENLDLVVAEEFQPQAGGASIACEGGDYALKRDLDELIHTPMFNRLYAPFYGHLFHRTVQAPDGGNVLLGLRREWRRLCKKDARVDDTTAKVDYDGEYYIFSVESLLTGELISVRMR